jgi:hypothetical protein
MARMSLGPLPTPPYALFVHPFVQAGDGDTDSLQDMVEMEDTKVHAVSAHCGGASAGCWALVAPWGTGWTARVPPPCPLLPCVCTAPELQWAERGGACMGAGYQVGSGPVC